MTGARKNMNNQLRYVIENVLIYGVDDEGDTLDVVEQLLESVRKTLERDQRFPRLTYREFELLFADFADEARKLLANYEQIDWKDAAEIVTDAVLDELNGGAVKEQQEVSGP